MARNRPSNIALALVRIGSLAVGGFITTSSISGLESAAAEPALPLLGITGGVLVTAVGILAPQVITSCFSNIIAIPRIIKEVFQAETIARDLEEGRIDEVDYIRETQMPEDLAADMLENNPHRNTILSVAFPQSDTDTEVESIDEEATSNSGTSSDSDTTLATHPRPTVEGPRQRNLTTSVRTTT